MFRVLVPRSKIWILSWIRWGVEEGRLGCKDVTRCGCWEATNIGIDPSEMGL